MHKGKILLVSEQPTTEVATFLERLGYGVAAAQCVASAALAALEHRPDAVVWIGAMGNQWKELRSVFGERFNMLELEEMPAEVSNPGVGPAAVVANGEAYPGAAATGTVQATWVREWPAPDGAIEVFSGSGDLEDGVGPWKVVGMEDLACLLEKQLRLGMPRLQHFYTKVGNKLRRVEVKDIRYIEVEGKYSAIHVAERKYNVKASLKDLLHKLPEQLFVRVSRNYVVNVDRIEHIDTFQYTVRIGELEIPISRTYKENLMRFIQLL